MGNYIDSVIKQFEYYRMVGKKAMNQIDDLALFLEPTIGTNSIAILVKHLHGNMLSRWTDFLSADGEKSWRNRADEFVAPPSERAELMELWDEGWECLFDSIPPLRTDQLQQ